MAAAVSHDLAELAPGTKSPNPEPYFSYAPLPQGWIRLLQVHDISDDPRFTPEELYEDIHVTLHTYPLSSCPDYTALSYTWGDPSPLPDPAYRVFSTEPRCFPVLHHNGSDGDDHPLLLRGTRNLRDALRRLRQTQQIRKSSRAPPKLVSDLDRSYGETWRGGLYWIDALCIDQDDLMERSAQVAIMGDIYRKAQVCIVWLGEKDDYAMVALQVAVNLIENPETTKELGMFQDRKVKNWPRALDFCSRAMHKLSNEEHIALAAFTSRLWFSRIWVLQEAILAQRGVILCGSFSMTFDGLLDLGTFMMLSNMRQVYTKAVTPAIEGKLGLRIAGSPGSYTETYQTLAMISSSHNLVRQGKLPDFLGVVSMAGKSESSDPRDRIYSVLGITAEFQSDSGPLIRPDYSLPVQTVYVHATALVAGSRNDLQFLTLTHERKSKIAPGLPSWCPDYDPNTAPLLPGGSASFGYSTAHLWDSEPAIEITDYRLLTVSGFCYDVIDDIFVPKTASAEVGYAHNCIGLLRLALHSMRDRDAQQTQAISPTRVELLWRLLNLDEFNGQTPAPPAAGLYFPTMLVLIALSTKSDQDRSHTLESDGADILEEYGRIISQLEALEPGSRPFLPDTELMRDYLRDGINSESVIEYMVEELDALHARSQQAGLEAEFESLLDPGGLGESIESTWLFNTTMGYSAIRAMVGRAMFALRVTGLLGLGLYSASVGDQVWFLHGAPTPVLLRPLEGGKFMFCGVAYIQGIMNKGMSKEEAKRFEVRRVSIE
ncbi:heterokaryon incompatibility protein-domain-containing protein [Xylariales sp. PMI_506]|nr:heterokaryon incompatibility protein-domain-containing protein [Xylariales sp. PMI_506]